MVVLERHPERGVGEDLCDDQYVTVSFASNDGTECHPLLTSNSFSFLAETDIETCTGDEYPDPDTDIEVFGGRGKTSSASATLRVYPTITTGELFLELDGAQVSEVWQVLDMNGRQVMEGGSLSGKYPVRVDVSQLAPGQYLVHRPERKQVVRFIKSR